MIKEFLGKLIKLPPPSERKDGLLSYKLLHPGMHLERDADYLCYLCFRTIAFVGIFILAAFILDAEYAARPLINPEIYQHDRLIVSFYLNFIMLPVIAVISAIFYFRIMLFIDLQKEGIPIPVRRVKLKEKQTKEAWRVWGVFIVAAFSASLVAGIYILLSGLVKHHDMQNSLLFVGTAECVAMVARGGGGAWIVASLVFMKKAQLFFPEVQADLEKMGKDMWEQ